MYIILADDQALMRGVFKDYLELYEGISGVGEVISGQELIRELAEKRYATHLVLDLRLSDGGVLSLLPHIRSFYKDLRIMVFSDPSPLVKNALHKFGVYHIVSKMNFGPEVYGQVKDFLYSQAAVTDINAEEVAGPLTSLSHAEKEILFYLLKGFSRSAIAGFLETAEGAVKSLEDNIFQKMEAQTLFDLVELVEQYNMLPSSRMKRVEDWKIDNPFDTTLQFAE